jgi:hypothetical protein
LLDILQELVPVGDTLTEHCVHMFLVDVPESLIRLPSFIVTVRIAEDVLKYLVGLLD